MPIKYCDKCNTERLRCEEEFNTDPKDYSLECPKCDEIDCPGCETRLDVIDVDGKRFMQCPHKCYPPFQLRVRKAKPREKVR